MIRALYPSLAAGLLVVCGPPARAQGTAPPPRFDAGIVLRAYEGLVDQQLEGTLNSLKALAATRDAIAGNWRGLKAPLQRLAAGLPASAAVWFARRDGSYLTVELGRTGQSLANRDYFPSLMRGEDVLGSLVISKSTGVRSVIVAAPIVRDARTVGALGVSFSATKLALQIERTLAVPRNVVFYALDARGRTALHRDTDLVFQFPSDIGDASLKAAVHRMLAEPQGIVRYTFRGARRTVVFRKSPLTGWVLALGILD